MDRRSQPRRQGYDKGASFQQTVVTLMKTCMGTGCLALPWLRNRADRLVCLGMVATAACYAVQRLRSACSMYPTITIIIANSQAVTVAEAKGSPDEGPNSWHDCRRSSMHGHSSVMSISYHLRWYFDVGHVVAYYAFGPIGLRKSSIS
jgi:hypothetical protein